VLLSQAVKTEGTRTWRVFYSFCKPVWRICYSNPLARKG
jgi:hypothetical protein